MGTKYWYKKIMVLGSGRLAYQCAEAGRRYLDNIEVLEYKVTEGTILRKLCEKASLPYFCCDKEQLYGRLLQEEENALIVSAGNTYLIPTEVISKPNLRIINWHNALLPHHRGRNAEAWCIYQGDAVTGITWHWLTEGVDAGDVIAQEKMDLDDKMTALKLFQKQCDLGVQVFENILEPLLLDQCQSRRQTETSNGQLHFSWEIPNGGILDTTWDYGQISRFLRSMDYGALRLLGKTYVEWQGEVYSFGRYRITKESAAERIFLWEDALILYKGGHKIVLQSLKKERKEEL